jgi:hypothetical protein
MEASQISGRRPGADAGRLGAIYIAAGLTLRCHPLVLLRSQLDRLGLRDTQKLTVMQQKAWGRLPGPC